jgi:hypothetical protein
MSLSKCKREIQSFLQKQKLEACKVVVLPDFFLDRIINLEWDDSEFSRLVADVAKRKGASMVFLKLICREETPSMSDQHWLV